MKYELETIPVWDAINEDTECPLCLLADKAEKGYVKFFLGHSVMVPEMRIEVNKTGFCGKHFEMMAKENNKHSLGLETHTRFEQVRKEMDKAMKRTTRLSDQLAEHGTGRGIREAVEQLKKNCRQIETSCMICDRIDKTLKRYLFTISYLWKKEEEFRTRYSESKGFCLKHLPLVLDMAPEVLRGKKLGAFYRATLELQQKSFERVEEDVLWYSRKFDQQYKDRPWGTAKDGLYRAIQKMNGLLIDHQ